MSNLVDTASAAANHSISSSSSSTGSNVFTDGTDNDAALIKKKSRRIPPERRKKVAKACDVCKKRKQRCNGLIPCDVCSSKHFDCTYTGVDRRNLKPSKKELESRKLLQQKNSSQPIQTETLNKQRKPLEVNPPPVPPPSKPELDYPSSQPSFLPPSLQPLFHFPLSIQPNEEEEDNDETKKNNDMTLVPEEEGLNSRLLYDTGGNLRYIGESSAGSFLPQCRKVFQKILGISKFTHDPQRFLMIDSPATRGMRVPVNLPPRDYANHLILLFKKYINNVSYVFNEEYFEKTLIETVFNNPLSASPKQLCLVYLVLAIGSIFAKIELQRSIFPFAINYFVEPHVFFESAQHLLQSTLNDSNLWLVETYYLMYFYDELNMTRNTSWINLGTAIRYAQGLGMQRRYVNESFKDPEYTLHRRKLFRSLYIADRLCAIHLGRSLTINDVEWDDKNSLNQFNDLQNEMLKVCLLNGKILTKVYHNPAIGMKNALKLAIELKIFTVNSSISKSLSLQNTLKYNGNHGLLWLHINHLDGIILLARPFFFFIILIKLKFIKFDEESKNYSNLKNFYQSCIKASLLTIKLIEFYFVNNLHPLKGYTIISCSFHAGLIIGMILLLQSQNIDDNLFDSKANVNGGENSKVVCISAMNSTISVLRHYGAIDPTSKRYGEILSNMMDATKVQQQTYQEFANRQKEQQQQQETGAVVPAPQSAAPPSQQPIPLQQHQFTTSAPVESLSYPQHMQNVDINLNTLINSAPSDITPGTAQRFEDWLFPKIDNSNPVSSSRSQSHQNNIQFGISPDSTSSADRNQNDDFLKDLAGFNNFTTSSLGTQFLDDFLFNVVDGNAR